MCVRKPLEMANASGRLGSSLPFSNAARPNGLQIRLVRSARDPFLAQVAEARTEFRVQTVAELLDGAPLLRREK